VSEYQAEYPAIWDIATYVSLNKLFGFHGAEVYDIYAPLDDVGTEGVPDTYGRLRQGEGVQRHERTEPREKRPLHPEEGGVVCSLCPVP
jgi:hypothetical protein